MAQPALVLQRWRPLSFRRSCTSHGFQDLPLKVRRDWQTGIVLSEAFHISPKLGRARTRSNRFRELVVCAPHLTRERMLACEFTPRTLGRVELPDTERSSRGARSLALGIFLALFAKSSREGRLANAKRWRRTLPGAGYFFFASLNALALLGSFFEISGLTRRPLAAVLIRRPRGYFIGADMLFFYSRVSHTNSSNVTMQDKPTLIQRHYPDVFPGLGIRKKKKRKKTLSSCNMKSAQYHYPDMLPDFGIRTDGTTLSGAT